MTLGKPLFAALLLVPIVLSSACFKFSRETPPLQQYVLAGPQQLSSAPAASARLSVGFRRLDLAAYLSVPSILIRRGGNEIVASEYHRWGEDIGEAINRVVAANLAGTPPVRSADIAPWAARARHDYIVQLHVMRFEGVADSAATTGVVHLQAMWDIIRPLDGRVLLRGTSDDRTSAWRVGNYTTLVNGLDSSLVRLARDIGGCLSRFRNDSTPPVSCERTGVQSSNRDSSDQPTP